MCLDQNFLEKVLDVRVIRYPGVQEAPEARAVFLPDAFQIHLRVSAMEYTSYLVASVIALSW